MEGEFDRDENRVDGPIVSLRLGKTRGFDPRFTDDSLQDSDLKRLAKLKVLEQLTLEWRTTFTDKGLLYLSVLKNLRTLNLSRTSIKGHGLAYLSPLRQLRELDLSGCRHLTDEPCTSLFLNDNPISDAGCVHLAGLKNLRRLWLNGPQLTGQSLAHLGSIDLKELFLTDTSISDDDLRLLEQNFPQLQVVNLSGTLMTDLGVQHLVGLNHLSVLIVDACVLSQNAIENLKLSLPDLLIVESQARALQEIRGKHRSFDQMPQGHDRVLEMAKVRSTIPKNKFIPIYSDAYFEVADELMYRTGAS